MKLFLFMIAAVASAQGLDPAALLKPATTTWPSYNGDYTGQRYSTLQQINRNNVGSLTMAWAFQTHQVPLKSTPLEVNGILYFTVPDHIWAIDARTGREIWHYFEATEGNHIGHRGVAMYNDRIYFGTVNAHLICLDARNGRKLWDVEVADEKFGFYISAPPLVVKDKLIVGISGDEIDIAGFLEARDPEDGKLLWKWNALPQPGEPGSETWPNAEKMSRGGGTTWVPGSYDPALNLIYWGTGNPHPVEAGAVRPGSNLYTCSIVALNPDTGKLAWYFQTSPHDTWDRDANQTPVIFDADFGGQPRRLMSIGSRSGYYFLLDRSTGESLVSVPYGPQNWSAGLDERGQPLPDSRQEQTRDGVFFEGSTTNWFAPSYSPQTKLFYISASHGFNVGYLTLNEADGEADNHQGAAINSLPSQSMLLAIEYDTGKIRWSQKTAMGARGGGGNGILTTAGGLLITGGSGSLMALDPATGDSLWHVNAGGNLTGSPMTYELDGRQYILTAVDSVLYAWALPANSIGR